MRWLTWFEDMAKARLWILRRNVEQSLHGAVIHAPPFAHQIVILIQDVNSAIHLRRFTFDRQSIVMEERRNVKRRLEEFQILIQSAK